MKHNLFKLLSLILSLTLVLLSTPLVLADENFSLQFLPELGTRILMNGHYLTPDVDPQLEKDDDFQSILVPLRSVLEEAEYTVTKKQDVESIKLKNGDLLSLNRTTGVATRNETEAGTFRVKVVQDFTLVAPEFFTLTNDISATWSLGTQTVVISSQKPKGILHYDLGEATMKTSLGQQLTYIMNGGLAIPDEKKSPVVIFLHGSHHVDQPETTRYDLGFSYAMQALADQGYLAISINSNWQYTLDQGEPMGLERLESIVKSHIEQLMLANQGKETQFGVDLTEQCDFSKVFLVGHSRAGGSIFSLATFLPNNVSDLSIAGLISIAPTDLDEQAIAAADLPTTIIVPELDGDVDTLDGFFGFDVIRTLSNRKQDAQLVYLYGANHNAFNQAIPRQDVGQQWNPTPPQPIPPAEQRSFLQQYLLAFVHTVTEEHTITSIGDSLSGALFEQRVMISNHIPGGVPLYTAHEDTVTAKNATLTPFLQSAIGANNTAKLFRHPGGDFNGNELKLLQLSWETSDAAATFATNNADCSNMETLNLYLTQDSTSPLNGQQDQSFTVELIDPQGKVYSVLLDETTPALMHQKGEPVHDNSLFSLYTPLGMVSIPLARFGEIKEIAEVRLSFTENQSGAIMLHDIRLAPKSRLATPEAEDTASKDSVPDKGTNFWWIFLLGGGIALVAIIGVAVFSIKRKKA